MDDVVFVTFAPCRDVFPDHSKTQTFKHGHVAGFANRIQHDHPAIQTRRSPDDLVNQPACNPLTLTRGIHRQANDVNMFAVHSKLDGADDACRCFGYQASALMEAFFLARRSFTGRPVDGSQRRERAFENVDDRIRVAGIGFANIDF